MAGRARVVSALGRKRGEFYAEEFDILVVQATSHAGLEFAAHPSLAIEIREHQALRVVSGGDGYVLDPLLRFRPRRLFFRLGCGGGSRTLVFRFRSFLIGSEDGAGQQNEKQKSGKGAGDSSATATKRQHE